MPNHVENHISLQGDEQKIREMLEAIQNDEFGVGTIDFNKIIPMPESLNIEAGSRTDNGLKAYRDFIEVYTFGRSAKDALKALKDIPVQSEEAFLRQRTDIRRDEWELGKTAWHNIQQYGDPTWYEWAIKHWDTKWNAYGYDQEQDYSSGNTISFQTAWNAPHPVIEKLAENYPEVSFEHEWADEDIGHNCGRYSYHAGKRTEEYFPETDKEAIEFACRAWDYDPLELDLCLNNTGTKYINLDYNDLQRIELLGQTALFTNARLNEEDIPQGLYLYHLRHGDDGNFCSIEPRVGANHAGSVITKEPIDFGTDNYLSFTDDTYPNFIGDDLTLGEYMSEEFDEEQSQNGGMQL